MPRSREDVGGARRLVVDPNEPAPTVMAGGVGSVNTSQYRLGEAKVPKISEAKPAKPPYRVPSMAEVAKVPWNGFNAISTFSGCGGSSLGYRMAGFRVLWASEFVEAARDSYRANMSPGTVLDDRDIREVTPESVLKAIKMKRGQLDLMDGSPPCASFSTAGKRQAGWGQVKKYSDREQRTDDLFYEFARLLEGIQPRTFVAENVSGLVKGTAKGYFLDILARLKACGYRVKCRVLDAQWLGVPQQRARTIFVGVREDLRDKAGAPIEPAHPGPLSHRYSVVDAIPWLVGGGMTHNRVEEEREVSTASPSPSVRAQRAAHLKIIQQQGAPGVGKKELEHGRQRPTVCGTQAQQFIVETESRMDGLATGREWDNIDIGGQSEKYFQLVKPALDGACPTVTAAGGNPGLASVCHPTERRKFSIAELRRICAFPDDFILTGSYAQQWERLGRAVPPLMMRAVAEVVRDQILRRVR